MTFMIPPVPEKLRSSARRYEGRVADENPSEVSEKPRVPLTEEGFRALGALEWFRKLDCLNGRDYTTSSLWD